MVSLRSRAAFTRLVEDALAQSFKGWDFSYLKDRMIESEPSWDFPELVRQKISGATSMLDLHTGGGEFLDSFAELPATTVATESYPPNVPLARTRLEARGVQVVEVISDRKLPLRDNTFELVVSRHGAYAPAELHRIMSPAESVFLSQQVGSDNLCGLNQVLCAAVTLDDSWDLAIASEQLLSNGFSITLGQEERLATSFKDIGAVVFYLLAIPWQIPDFSLENFRKPLFNLHQRIEADGSFDTDAQRFVTEAQISQKDLRAEH